MSGEMDRREFISKLGQCGLGLMGFCLPGGPFKPEKKIRDILGFHDTPNSGGSINVELALSDILYLGGGRITGINLSEYLLRHSQSLGLTVTNRIDLPANHFMASTIGAEAEKVCRYVENPFFVPFNEVNLLQETGGEEVSPSEHIEAHFVPAVELISRVAKKHNKRARVLITPLAQDAPKICGFDEEAYFEEMLKCLGPYMAKLDCDLQLGLHPYILHPGDNPIDYIQRRHNKAREILGVELPIQATEAGLQHTKDSDYSQELIAAETVRILNIPIPAGLPLEGFDLWILANYAQRPAVPRNEELDIFEKAAFRAWWGVTLAYQALADLPKPST